MPKRDIEFVNGEIYHITMRGVDGRLIFMNDEDRWRGIFSLYEFNTESGVTIRQQREKRKRFKESIKARRLPESAEQPDRRKKLVEILSFELMPNHIHLLVLQSKPNGVTEFVKKFNLGYAKYFNAKYKRIGALFQGRFQAKFIDGDEYLKTAFVYIHTNPISIIEPGWKEKGIKNPKKAKRFLEEYRWSSYLDYIGKKNFPSITSREFMLKLFGDEGEIKKFVDAWIEYKQKRSTDSGSL